MIFWLLITIVFGPFLFWQTARLIFWLLLWMDGPSLQEKPWSSGGNLRLYDGGYSGTHEKYKSKDDSKAAAVPEVQD